MSRAMYYTTDRDVCMYCADHLRGKSKIACDLSPHADEHETCGNFSCLSCYKYVKATISICPKVKVVCENGDECDRSKALFRPSVVCACTRAVCMTCYPLDEFMEAGICQVCVEKKDLLEAKSDGGKEVKREPEDDGASAGASKRARV